MRRLFAAALLVPCAPGAFAMSTTVDSQLWSELDATRLIAAQWSVTAILATRIGSELPNPTLTAGGLQLDYRVGSWTATGTGYYVSIRNAQGGARTDIWLPAAALAYGLSLGPIAFSDRNRFEQLDGLPGSPTRYRNRASAEWHVAGWQALTDVFIADEVFYDFSRARWTRNRAQMGLQFQLASHTWLQTFYLRQNNSYGSPDRFNVLGLTLQLDFQ